jgi:RNA polymerase sigma-70 factor (subfamily 1)
VNIDGILKTYRQHLRAIAARQLGNDLRSKADASDVVQDTCLEAFQECRRFEGLTDDEAKALLTRILIHNIQGLVRQYRGTEKRDIRREICLDGNPNGYELAVGAATPAEEVATREECEKLARLMSRLPARQRNVLVWRSSDDHTFRQIGERLGCSGVAARKLCLKVVERLRRELERTGP